LVDEVGQYAEIGFDEVIVPDFALGPTTEARADAFRQFNEEVASQFT